MPDELTKYRRRRDPDQTTEPFGPELKTSATVTRTGRFVVHLHAATRRHYDLRLEIGGVLRSFAVPRGPTLDPSTKRLAVETEAHPLEYWDFEGVIPPGNYGAGAMIAWDQGLVTYRDTSAEEQYAAGKLDMHLAGFKLQGRFALVRTSGRSAAATTYSSSEAVHWLLIYHAEGPKPAAAPVEHAPFSILSGLTVDDLPRQAELAHQLTTAAAQAGAPRLATDPPPNMGQWQPSVCSSDLPPPFEHPEWLYELKLDGVRVVAERSGPNVTLRYRTGRVITLHYPEVARAIATLPVKRLVLDGEIVAYDERGHPNFQRLGPRIQRPLADPLQCAKHPVFYLAFDLLVLGEHDLRPIPLTARKALLARLLPGKGRIRLLDHIDANGTALLNFCQTQGLEGIVAKRRSSTYLHGPGPNPAWRKYKCERDDDFVVVGYTSGQGSRAALGALELASRDRAGGPLKLRGRVGSGFDETTLAILLQHLAPLTQAQCAAEGTPEAAPAGLHFVAPHIVVAVRYAGWSDRGRLRHGVFKGLRADVAPADCLASPSPVQESEPPAPTTPTTASWVTHPDKRYWPQEGHTKGDLCGYYDAIADTLLPHLQGRPTLIVRYPDGITGKAFYQWRPPAGAPTWLGTIALPSEKHAERRAFLIEDRASLLFLANLGAIPFHVLACRTGRLQQADFLTLDFDLGQAPLTHAVTLTRSLQTLLERIGLVGYPKTSGQTGLHVLIPAGGASFATTKLLANLLGHLLLQQHPDLATLERRRAARPEHKVYIDAGQTGARRTIVAPYAVRAYPGATVSTPLTWDEVSLTLAPHQHHMFSVPARIARSGDPMADLYDRAVSLPATIAALATHLQQPSDT